MRENINDSCFGFRILHSALNGAPGANRTRDNLLRRQVLYPTELRALPKLFVSSAWCVLDAIETNQKPASTEPELCTSHAFNGELLARSWVKGKPIAMVKSQTSLRRIQVAQEKRPRA
jgi:hypothetical protein